MSGPAAIATSPLMAPFNPARRSTRPSACRDKASAVSTPVAAARFVLVTITLTATASAALPRASCEPPLKPRKPNQMMNTPSVTAGTLDGGVASTLPSLRNLFRRAPTITAPASAAQPPVECTTVEPAKSLKPNAPSHPPPQVQAPTSG